MVPEKVEEAKEEARIGVNGAEEGKSSMWLGLRRPEMKGMQETRSRT